MFLQKFFFIKILIDFSNNNEELNYLFNEISTKKLFALLNLDKLYNILTKNEKDIDFLDIFDLLPEIFNLNDVLFKEFKNNFNYGNIFDLLLLNIKKCKLSGYLTKELIINFSPIKFDFIHLDDDLFDWIENTLEKKCTICSKISKYGYICLICGNKICNTSTCNNYDDHIKKCCGDTSILIDMDNMKASIFTSYRNEKSCFPLYLNENGIGPKGYEIGNEYKLSKEKLKLAIKIYSCNDFNFD